MDDATNQPDRPDFEDERRRLEGLTSEQLRARLISGLDQMETHLRKLWMRQCVLRFQEEVLEFGEKEGITRWFNLRVFDDVLFAGLAFKRGVISEQGFRDWCQRQYDEAAEDGSVELPEAGEFAELVIQILRELSGKASD